MVEASPAMWRGGLYPIELAGICNAVDRRVREFTAGRNCARAALGRLGLASMPIPIGDDRAPVFPRHVSCSITHTGSLCVAAAIVRGAVDSLGIDAEENAALDKDLTGSILSCEELAAFRDLERVPYDLPKLAFSAKEAFYKAYYQQTRSWLDFHDVSVAFDTCLRTFRIAILNSAADGRLVGSSFEGRYAVDEQRVYCAISLPSLHAACYEEICA